MRVSPQTVQAPHFIESQTHYLLLVSHENGTRKQRKWGGFREIVKILILQLIDVNTVKMITKMLT
jgi:hypothetical protein